MSQGRRAPQQQHLNMRVKPEPGLLPSGPPSTNGKAVHQANGIEGKRRKLVAQKTPNGGLETTNPLHQQWNTTSSDGTIVFKILSQPESQHRARYQTEGSRGAIKDRAGAGFPVLKLEGYSRPSRIQIFIGNDAGKVVPHMFYQVCRVTGKNSNPCDERKMDGTDVIELSFEPQLGNQTILCDCVGILKERFADVEARFPKLKTWKNVKKKSTKCRLVFRTVVENSRGEHETLQVVSDVINCTQLPGTPEILKMSTSGSSIEGGEELWIIGKNFLKDTKVIFSHSVPGKTEPLWNKFTDPDQDLFHQTHLITKIPPFYNSDIQEEVEVTVYIKCGDKLSDPTPFTYRPKPLQFTYSHPGPGMAQDAALPRGVAAPAVAIAQQFAQTGSVSVISAVEKVEVDASQPRPTILEPLHEHKNKKSRLDYAGRNARRTRSVPRPNLINEDTVFVSEGTGVKVIYTSFAQNPMSPWKGRSPAPDLVPSVIHNSPQPILPDPLQPAAKRSFSFNDESSNSCFSYAENTRDTMVDENSHKHVQTNSDFSSSLTTDFSNVFRFTQTQTQTPACETTLATSFPSLVASYPTTPPSPKAEVEPIILPQENTKDAAPRPPSANDSVTEDNKELPNVSVKATSEDKATISISLPTSILRDQKHFQNVIETINNTLLRSSFNEPEESEQDTKEAAATSPPVPTFNSAATGTTSTPPRASVTSPGGWPAQETPAPTWTKSPPPGLAAHSPPLPTSHPVSVLSCRKRNFSSDFSTEPLLAPVVDQPPEFFAGDAAVTGAASTVQEEFVVEEFKLPAATVSSVISETPGSSAPRQPASGAAFQEPFKPMEVTPPPESPQFMVYQETLQEKKWTAEFNQVMQTVIEDHKEGKAMEWSAPATGPAPATVQWSAPVTEAAPATVQWTAPAAEPAPATVQWCTPTTQPAPATAAGEWKAPADPAGAGKEQQGMEWSIVKEAATPAPAPQYIAVAAAPAPAPQYIVVAPAPAPAPQYIAMDPTPAYPVETPLAKPIVQFLDPPDRPAVYDQFGAQILTNSFPVPPLPVLESVVEQIPMTTYTGGPPPLVAIQGDPMLSETSSVIGAQKEIESAYLPGEERAMGADQQWGHEWTYGSST